MAWASKKQYAILMESEEGKDLVEKLPDMSQDEFQVEFGKLIGKSGQTYNKEDYEDNDDDERQEIIDSGKSEWVKSSGDEKVWNGLSDDDKYLLSMSLDMGFDADELNDNPEGRDKLKELESKFGKKDETSEETEIDYENVEYPKGTSKEYSQSVNEKYEQALPVLEKVGLKPEDFGGKANEQGGYEDNTSEIMDKYVFEPFRKKYPGGNNEAWKKDYQPLYDAIDAVLDKKYNDWYIRNTPKDKNKD